MELTLTLTQAAAARLAQRKIYGHIIGGEWVESSSGETIELENPATLEDLARVQAGNAHDVACRRRCHRHISEMIALVALQRQGILFGKIASKRSIVTRSRKRWLSTWRRHRLGTAWMSRHQMPNERCEG